MGSRSFKGPIWLWGGAFVLLAAALVATMLFLQGPAALTKPLTNPDPNPTSLSRLDPAARNEVLELLAVAGRVRLDGSQATQLLRPWHDKDIEGLNLEVESGRLVIDIAKREGASWINVHMEASAFEIVDGYFQQLVIHSLRVSGWDLTPAWQGQDISERANEELDDARRRDSRTSRTLATLDGVSFTGTHLEVHTTWPDIRSAYLGTTTTRDREAR